MLFIRMMIVSKFSGMARAHQRFKQTRLLEGKIWYSTANVKSCHIILDAKRYHCGQICNRLSTQTLVREVRGTVIAIAGSSMRSCSILKRGKSPIFVHAQKSPCLA